MTETYYFRVSGHVQGVGFRAATRDTAARLGLRGWVRNRDDGSVELIAAGSPGAVDELRDWLRQGPPTAEVRDVEAHAETRDDVPDTFTVR